MLMSCPASLLLMLLLAQTPTPDAHDLIPQLGSRRYAERQAATTALERLGQRAMPALRAAREQRDPEIRARASALLARIEGGLLVQPSLVALQFNDAPLSEVIR